MDRIAALRTVEDALSEFEAGEIDLDALETRVTGTLRTYATEFEDGTRRAYKATGDPSVEGAVVVADSPAAARAQFEELLDADRPALEIERAD